MQLLESGDPTTLSYWLNWRVFLCATWVFTSILIGFYFIWKYEHSDITNHGGSTQKNSLANSSYDAAWKPCLKVHPMYLLFFRIIAFCLLFVAITFDVVEHGFELYYYYTQWTFTLVTIYFGLGSSLSLHGCFFLNRKMNSSSKYHLSKDMENGLFMPLVSGVNKNDEKVAQCLDRPGTLHLLLTSGFWGHLLQVLFQLTAGAVAITDLVYWCVMFPFLSIKDYGMNFLTVVAHSLNAIMLLGETALNSLQFPLFRISYFLILTGIYVIFQWIVHASVSIWWPYPFLDLAVSLSPLWYLVVALLHVPSYALFVLLTKVKHSLFSRCFPQSYCFADEIVS